MIKLAATSAAAIAVVAAMACTPAHAQTGPVVTTSNGPVQGIAGSPAAFLGIPYAAPPVGGNRWRPPQPVPYSFSIRQATAYGPACPQPASVFGTASTNEDCLYLNVQTPAADGGKRPVMVWLHGGAFSLGSGSAYDATALVGAGNVVVVTINYRLGLLGWLYYAPLANELFNQAGNYGLADQIAALKWVKSNIAAFGGDPGNVTVFGESAGGSSIADLLASPAASGLFNKAIIESGYYNAYVPSASTASGSYQSMLAKTSCGQNATAACLRSLPVSAILAAQAQPTTGASVLWDVIKVGPVSGTSLLPNTPITAYQNGNTNKVTILNGINRNEGRGLIVAGFNQTQDPLSLTAYSNESLLMPNQTYNSVLNFLLGPVLAPVIINNYGANQTAASLLDDIVTDAGFACSAAIADDALVANNTVYAYEFNDTASWTALVPPSNFYPNGDGATHTNELSYLWPAFQSEFPSLNATHHPTPAQLALAQTMRTAWTNFARTGNPNGAGVPSWPAYRKGGTNIVSLDTGGSGVETDYVSRHSCGLWEPILGLDLALPLSILGNF